MRVKRSLNDRLGDIDGRMSRGSARGAARILSDTASVTTKQHIIATGTPADMLPSMSATASDMHARTATSKTTIPRRTTIDRPARTMGRLYRGSDRSAPGRCVDGDDVSG